MLGYLYMILCITTGYVLCRLFFPSLLTITEKTYTGKNITINKYFVLFPAWFIFGTLPITWITYITAMIFKANDKPLIAGNIVSMSVAFLISVFGIVYFSKKHDMVVFNKRKKGSEFDKLTMPEIICTVLIMILGCLLMWMTFYVKDNTLYVGYTVFSDFAPHLGMIRSFSYGNNFPTQYSHYAGEDIRYHFMFQFLAGNLEFLGIRIDNAFNIPSLIGFVSMFSLLYVYSVKLTGRKLVGFFACLFFAFRSSTSLFSFLAGISKGTSVLEALAENTEFISTTTNESWGLWNLNVYCNQRHLALCVALLILILMIFTPHLFDAFQRIKDAYEKKEGTQRISNVQMFIETSFLSKEGWKVTNWVQPIAAGIILGMSAFWNGAALLTALMVLFCLAIVSDRRLEFLITAVLTTALSLLQTKVFITDSVVETKLYFGFIAENPTLFGSLDYIWRLIGIAAIVLLVAFVMVKGIYKYLLFAFSAPFIFSFCISLTVDVTVNHKYIMISLMLMGIVAAMLIVKMLDVKDTWMRILAVFVVFCMTATGIYDFRTILVGNGKYEIDGNEYVKCITINLDDPLIKWVDENSTSQDIFLTPNYALHRIVLGGGMLFNGHQYYAMTAGYDTALRDTLMKEMYEASSSDELDEMIKENNIRFVVIDRDCRTATGYTVNEAVFDMTYKAVYTEDEGDWQLKVYDTEKRIN